MEDFTPEERVQKLPEIDENEHEPPPLVDFQDLGENQRFLSDGELDPARDILDWGGFMPSDSMSAVLSRAEISDSYSVGEELMVHSHMSVEQSSCPCYRIWKHV